MTYNLNLPGIAKVSEKANAKGVWTVTPTEGKPKGVKDDTVTAMVGAYATTYSEDTTLSPEDIAALYVVHADLSGDDFIEKMHEYQAEDTETAEVEDVTKPDIMQQLKDTLAKGKPAATPKPGTKDTAPVSATERDRLAIELGHKLEGAGDLLSDMREGYTIKERARILPVSIAWKFSKLYTPEEIASMPTPGSEEPKDAKDRRPNMRYDIRSGVGSGSWYGDLAKGVPWYAQDIGQPLEQITKRLKGEESSWPVKGEKALRADKAMYQTRGSTLAAQMRGAVALIRKMEEVKEKTDLEVSYRLTKKDGHDVVEHTTAPLLIAYQDAKKSREYAVMGVGSFMLVNVDKVAKATDQLSAFVAERGSSDEVKEAIDLKNDRDVYDAFLSFHTKYKGDTGFMSNLNKALNKNNLEFVDMLFTMKNDLVNICAKKSARDLHALFVEQQEAVKEKEASALKAKEAATQ